MARYIDADKIVDIIKTDIKQCEIDVSESCGDEFYEMAVNSRSNAMYSILREIESAPTADVVPRAELEHILSDLKKEIHDKAVYPNCHGVEPYISLKVFDAVINKLIGS